MTTSQNLSNLSQLFSTTPLPFRNKLINGNFDIWQRGVSASAAGYLADRWCLYTGGTGVALTTGRGGFPIGDSGISVTPSRYYWYTTITNGGDSTNGVVVVTQKIEGVDSLRGKITVSFGAATSAGQKIAVNVFQNFGTGGSPSAAVQCTPQQITPPAAFGINRYTMTFDLPSTSGKTLGSNGDDNIEIAFYFSGGTAFNSKTGTIGIQTGTFYLAAVQVETGPVATPMEQRPIALELQLCQRYYQLYTNMKYWGYGTAAQADGATLSFPAMRSVPSAVFGGFSGANAGSSVTAEIITYMSVSFYILPSSGTGSYAYSFNLALHAEL